MKKERSFWTSKVSAIVLTFIVMLTAFLSLPNSASAASCPSKKSCVPVSVLSTQKKPVPKPPITKPKSQELICPTGMTCGSYTISGLGARKQQILKAGGTTLDLAVAMLETETMQATYPYGDSKSGDAANFGIFKQNWYMLRSACSSFKDQNVSQYHNGALLNSSLSTDVACMNQSQSYYGLSTWFAGERNGQGGISNPNTADINAYKTAVYWIQSQLIANSANLSNDTRFWVEVPAI